MRLTRKGKIVLLSVIMSTSSIITSPFHTVEAAPVVVSDAAVYLYTAPEKKTPVAKKKVPAPRWQPRASRSHARTAINEYGWGPREFVCLDLLWTHESNWRHAAKSKIPVYQNGVKLYAGGIPQILGLSPKTPVPVQIQRGLDYIEGRYGSPCAAWSAWKKRADYYNGGYHGGWY